LLSSLEDGAKIIQISNLEKRLQIYGELITILKSCEHKAMRKHLDDTDPLKSNGVASHVLENPFDSNRSQKIFEKSPSYSLTLGKIIGAMVQIHNRG
jgi:hypothetical protein